MAETKRLRVSKACDSCRRKKVKCDALHPLCTNCETFGYECTYNDPTKKRGPPKGYIEAIEARLHRMEGLLGGLVKDKDPRAEIVRAELDAMAREAEMTGLKLRRSRAYEEINHKIGSGSSSNASPTPTSLSTSMASGLSISSPGQAGQAGPAGHGKKSNPKHPAPGQNTSYSGLSSHQIQPNAVGGNTAAASATAMRPADMTIPPLHTPTRHMGGGLQPSPMPAVSHMDHPARPYDSMYGSSSSAGRGNQPSPYYPGSQPFQHASSSSSSPNDSPKSGTHMIGSTHGMNGLGLQDMSPSSVDVHGPYSGHRQQQSQQNHYHHHQQQQSSYPPYSSMSHHHHNGSSSVNNEKQTLDELRMQFMTKTLPPQPSRRPASSQQRSLHQESASQRLPSPTAAPTLAPVLPLSHPLTGYLPEENTDIGQQLVMPAPDVIDHLLQVHFAHVHPVLPMLHFKTLSEQIHQQPTASSINSMFTPTTASSATCTPPHLAFAMMGLASRFSHNPVFRNPAPGMPRPPCTIFYERAKFFIKNEYDNSHMSTIQALLLMAVQQMGFCESQRAWLYVGMAIRMAQDLGLNREPSLPEKERDPLWTELRKRTWWSCYVVERLVCAGLGRPLTITGRECLTSLPTMEDEPMPAAMTGGPNQQVAVISHFAHLVTLSRLQGSILEFIQARASERQEAKDSQEAASGAGGGMNSGVNGSTTTTTTTTTKGPDLNSFTHSPSLARELERDRYEIDTSAAAFAALDKALMAWRQNLPENLRDPTATSPHFGLFLHLTYNTLLILLHRPEIPFSPTSASLCTQAAMTISDIIEILMKARALSSMFISILYAIFSAGVIHFMNIPGTKRPQQPSRAPSPAPSSSSVYSTPRMNDGGSGGSGYGLGLSTNGGANWTGGHANGGQSYTQLQSQQQPQQPSAVDQQASLTAKTNLKRCIDALRFLASQWLSAARRAKVLEDLLDLKHVSLRDLEEDTFQTVNLDPDWTSNTGYALALRGPRERHDKLRQRCRSKVMAIQSLLANDDDHVTSHPHHPHPYKMTEKQQTSRHRRNFSDESMQEPVQQQQQEMDMGTTPSSLDMGMDPPPSVPSIKADQDITMEQAPSASTSVTSSTSTVPFTTLAHPTYLLKQEATLSGTAADKGVSSSSSCSPSSLVDQAMKEAGFGRVVPTPTLTQTSSLGLDFDPMMLLGSEDPGMVALTATTQNAGSAVSSSPSAVSASTSTTAPPSSLITSEAIMAGLGLSSATTSAPVSSIQILTPPSVSCAGGGIGGGVTSANMFDPFSMPSSITFPLGHSPMLAAAPPVATTNAATGGVMVNQAESMASPTLSTSSSSMSLLQEPVAQQQQSASTSSELDQSLGSLSSSGVEKKVAPTQQLLGQPVVSTVGSPTWEYHGQMGKAASTRTGLTVQEQEMQDLAWNDMPVTLGLDEWMAYIGALMMRWLASGESSPKASPPSL